MSNFACPTWSACLAASSLQIANTPQAGDCIDGNLSRMVCGVADVTRDEALRFQDGVSKLPVYSHIASVTDFTRPFVVTNFSGLSRDHDFFARELSHEPEIYGYDVSPMDNSESDAITRTGAEVLQLFRERTLNFNIVDSECSDPSAILNSWPADKLKRPPSISWTLTLAPARTYFHYDPPYGDCFMYLCEGHKVWLFISPDDIAQIERRHGFEIVNRLPLSELLALDDGFLRGRILIGEIRGGDFVYFPEGWAHYVRTLKDSFGYGGYFGGD
jgi:hypothetical protein